MSTRDVVVLEHVYHGIKDVQAARQDILNGASAVDTLGHLGDAEAWLATIGAQVLGVPLSTAPLDVAILVGRAIEGKPTMLSLGFVDAGGEAPAAPAAPSVPAPRLPRVHLDTTMREILGADDSWHEGTWTTFLHAATDLAQDACDFADDQAAGDPEPGCREELDARRRIVGVISLAKQGLAMFDADVAARKAGAK